MTQKKVLALLLTLCLVFSMTVPAYAASSRSSSWPWTSSSAATKEEPASTSNGSLVLVEDDTTVTEGTELRASTYVLTNDGSASSASADVYIEVDTSMTASELAKAAEEGETFFYLSNGVYYEVTIAKSSIGAFIKRTFYTLTANNVRIATLYGTSKLSSARVTLYTKEAAVSAAALTAAGEALTASGVAFTAITRDTNIIAQVVAGNGGVLGCFSAEQIATITEFSQHMNFLGIDLTRIPKLGLSLDIVLPLLSVITMLLSTHISMKASGQQMQGSMKLTMYMMPLMYLFFCFTYPLAFSLYYVISNIVMTVQTQVMRKVYDPDKMRKEIEAQIAEKKKQEKRGVKNTTVKVTDPKTGETTEKNLSASEMNKRRLEYARKLDEERYKDERTVPLSELNKQDKE